MNTLITSIVSQIKDLHQGDNWIGVNMEKMINPLNDEAFFFNANGFHSVAETLSHLTVWRNESLLKIRTGEGSITDSDPSNWKNNSDLIQQGKDSILTSYHKSLKSLLDALATKNDDFLDQTYYDTDFKDYYPFSFLLYGMIHHDVYHLGQLGMIIKLMNSNNVS